jgi:hypothetical protein
LSKWSLIPASVKMRKPYTRGETFEKSVWLGRVVVCPKCGDYGRLRAKIRYKNRKETNRYLSVQHFDERGRYSRTCYLGVEEEVNI